MVDREKITAINACCFAKLVEWGQEFMSESIKDGERVRQHVHKVMAQLSALKEQQRAREKPNPTSEPGTLDLEDFGDEVRLSFDQRVPWSVALEILRLLKLEEVGRKKRDRRDE